MEEPAAVLPRYKMEMKTNKEKSKDLCQQLLKKHLPIVEWLPKYKLKYIMQDVLAGVTVALTEIPHSIVCAIVAGVSPEYGLYSCFMGGLIYAIFGTCKDVSIGPTVIFSVILRHHLEQLGPQVIVLTTFLSGVITLLLGLLNLGFIIEFFSYPVITGFTWAISLQVSSTQMNNVFGIPDKPQDFLDAWKILFGNFDKAAKSDSILGLSSIVSLILLRGFGRLGTSKFRPNWSKRRNVLGYLIFLISIARSVIVVVIGTLVVYSLQDVPFRITGEVKAGFPLFTLPPFSSVSNGTQYSFLDIIKVLNTAVLLVPIIMILEMISVGKTFFRGKLLDTTQEILTLGLSNTLGSFIGSMPTTGTFIRSAINNASGVRTPLAGVITSVMLFLAIAFLTPQFFYVPKACLAAVIICALMSLIDYKDIVLIWKNKKLDLVPFLATLLSGLFISLEYGILIGTLVNLLFVLYSSARPKLNLERRKISGRDIFVVTPMDTLYFPAADYLAQAIWKCQENNIPVIIDGKNIRNIDITIAKRLVTFTNEMTDKGHKILLCNCKKSVLNICVGIDENFINYFKSGLLEDIIHNLPNNTGFPMDNMNNHVNNSAAQVQTNSEDV